MKLSTKADGMPSAEYRLIVIWSWEYIRLPAWRRKW